MSRLDTAIRRPAVQLPLWGFTSRHGRGEAPHGLWPWRLQAFLVWSAQELGCSWFEEGPGGVWQREIPYLSFNTGKAFCWGCEGACICAGISNPCADWIVIGFRTPAIAYDCQTANGLTPWEDGGYLSVLRRWSPSFACLWTDSAFSQICTLPDKGCASIIGCGVQLG